MSYGVLAVILALLVNLVRLLFLPLHLVRRLRASPKDAYVKLVIDGPVVDYLKPSPALWFARRAGKAALSVGEVRELGRQLAEDDRPRGLLVHVKMVLAGPAVLASLRDALLAIRASGKDLVVYLPYGADNQAMLLASAARRIIVGPETLVAPLGYAAQGRYVRRALEHLGVEPEVYAKGMYKSAGEMFLRDSMSDAQREQVTALLDTRHEALLSALATGRGVDRERANTWIDDAPHGATRAQELGIVDAVAYEDELPRLVLGGSDDKPVKTIPAGRYVSRRRGTRFRPIGRRGAIGVIEVHGPIVGSPRVLFGSVAAEGPLIAALRLARATPALRGVVLHIDSPGGSALASDRIYHEVVRLAELKPVVAYFSNVAASGGYYIGAGAHAIVAQPETVTGSIGVVAARFVVAPLLERLGVLTDVVKRGAHADMLSPTRRFDERERATFERELDSFYRRFLRVVATGRHKPVEDIEPLAQGRVYSGVAAHERGLVDHLGGFDRAIDEVRTRLGDARLEAVLVRPPRGPLPPPDLPTPAALASLLSLSGLEDLAEIAQLGLDAHRDPFLTYWPGATEGARSTPYR